MLLRKWRAIPACLLVAVTACVATRGCAQTDARLGDEAPDAAPTSSSFTPPPSADAAIDAPSTQLLQCIGTVCPAPFATCSSENGPTYKCGTDLARDPNNCGACGNKCLVYAPIALSSRCVDGACELECMNKPSTPTDFRNCNGAIDDGCEIDVSADEQNCGACGNVCPSGQSCMNGKCGCSSGQIECPTPEGPTCVNPKTDDANCGGCGIECAPPADACDPLPTNLYYGCKSGTCGHQKCGGFSADCNNDVGTAQCASDGCEVDDVRFDRNNCGGCGVKCAAAEECVDEGNGYECAVPCARFGKTLCPASGQCVDLLSDVSDCGGCGNVCPVAGPNQVASCNKGLCAYECTPGFADCNGTSADGCETNLQTHAGNCGACGKRCDSAAGQPCIEGKCLMTACDAGVTN
ncbi:MAG: Tryptophan synthase alpha chain [Myxococcaceae bacterium]|nr:Tryptophan synthase alpha chain [Myxococcaceae bacterium]